MEEVLVSLIVSPVAAFAVGAVVRRRIWRGIFLLATLAAPLFIYTWWLASAPAGREGFWGWWIAGIVMGAIPFLLAAAATLAGFYVGRVLGRSAGIG